MAASLHKYTVVEAQNAALGQAGAKFISDGEEHTGSFVAIQCLEDTVFEELIPEDTTNGYGVGSYNGNTMASETIPAGATIYGRWTKIELDVSSGGLVIAYQG